MNGKNVSSRSSTHSSTNGSIPSRIIVSSCHQADLFVSKLWSASRSAVGSPSGRPRLPQPVIRPVHEVLPTADLRPPSLPAALAQVVHTDAPLACDLHKRRAVVHPRRRCPMPAKRHSACIQSRAFCVCCSHCGAVTDAPQRCPYLLQESCS